ncbi:hypothetical protein QH494_21640 [Sphingomonas sp. AR_OL41]|nr:hypothetical protein [Sphingomonas sp. AR_OL41]MDH7974801.1 hypothetical protein [Sphingomonas sp. AR_OL41]
MLIAKHGELAEIHADEQIASARAAGNSGDEIAWRQIADKILEIRSGDAG